MIFEQGAFLRANAAMTSCQYNRFLVLMHHARSLLLDRVINLNLLCYHLWHAAAVVHVANALGLSCCLFFSGELLNRLDRHKMDGNTKKSSLYDESMTR